MSSWLSAPLVRLLPLEGPGLGVWGGDAELPPLLPPPLSPALLLLPPLLRLLPLLLLQLPELLSEDGVF